MSSLPITIQSQKASSEYIGNKSRFENHNFNYNRFIDAINSNEIKNPGASRCDLQKLSNTTELHREWFNTIKFMRFPYSWGFCGSIKLVQKQSFWKCVELRKLKYLKGVNIVIIFILPTFPTQSSEEIHLEQPLSTIYGRNLVAWSTSLSLLSVRLVLNFL